MTDEELGKERSKLLFSCETEGMSTSGRLAVRLGFDAAAKLIREKEVEPIKRECKLWREEAEGG